MAAKKKAQANELALKMEAGWNKLNKRESNALAKFCEDYRVFLSGAKTERKAHDLGLELAQSAGFTDLKDAVAKGTKLKSGDRVYYSAAGKTLFLAIVGKRSIVEGMRIVGID